MGAKESMAYAGTIAGMARSYKKLIGDEGHVVTASSNAPFGGKMSLYSTDWKTP